MTRSDQQHDTGSTARPSARTWPRRICLAVSRRAQRGRAGRLRLVLAAAAAGPGHPAQLPPFAGTGISGGSSSPATAASQPAAQPAVITIDKFAYAVPASVSPGAMITVVNKDGEAHTVTADSGSAFDDKATAGASTPVHGADPARQLSVPLHLPLEHARRPGREVSPDRHAAARRLADFALRGVTAAGLLIDAVVHLQLAANYQLAAPGGIGQGNLFRIEAALAVLALLLVLGTGSRAGYARGFRGSSRRSWPRCWSTATSSCPVRAGPGHVRAGVVLQEEPHRGGRGGGRRGRPGRISATAPIRSGEAPRTTDTSHSSPGILPG